MTRCPMNKVREPPAADPIPLLHLHAQTAWHDPAYLIGNPKGLRRLMRAIAEALAQGHSTSAEVFVNDGEGFRVRVLCDERLVNKDGGFLAPHPIPLLHLHAQSAWHDPAYLIGHPEGLRRLIHALTEALAQGHSTSAEVFVNDGEGFRVRVLCDESPWDAPSWTHRAVPYTDEPAWETHATRVWPETEFRAAACHPERPEP